MKRRNFIKSMFGVSMIIPMSKALSKYEPEIDDRARNHLRVFTKFIDPPPNHFNCRCSIMPVMPVIATHHNIVGTTGYEISKFSIGSV